jgi:SAM-dependent methyltransferase
MEEAEYQRMVEAEQRSWWFRGRRRILDAVIGRLGLPHPATILDVGCGTGGNLPMLARHGAATGVEFFEGAAQLAREQSGCEVHCGPAEAIPIAEGAYDLVTMFDVLEHLEVEAPALGEVARLLAPGGRFVFTVPAFMFLWSGHDVALHHHRRYRRGQLKRVLEAAGFHVDWLSYYNVGLFPAVAAVRMLRKLRGGGEEKADVAAGDGPLATLLETAFAFERHLVGRIPAPVGVSLIGVARTVQ